MPEFEKQKNPNQSGFQARSAVRGRSMPKPAHDDNPVLAQQQVLGNQVMQRFAESCPLTLPSASICPFGGVCHTCPARVQTKLTIGQPGDKYEQEADQVAEEVMRMSDLNISASSQSEGVPPADHIQRLCPECEDELQRQPEEEEEELLQTKGGANRIPAASSGLESRIHSLKGGGQPLPESVRSFFEPRYGYDFSQVRVHTDMQAAEAAKSVNARAFTLDRDVVFEKGQYAPETVEGRRLLAHELTHVAQQAGTLQEIGASSHQAKIKSISQSLTIQRAVRVVISTTRCTDSHARTIAEAIPGARNMVWTALNWMISFNPRNRAIVDDRLRKNFLSDTQDTFDNVKSRLRLIYSGLNDAQNGRVNFDCAPISDPECTGRDGYILAADRRIHICPSFFPDTLEERRWMLIHEFAHVAGALRSPEYYHAYFGAVPCDDPSPLPSSTAALENADNYARFVWCLTRRPGIVLSPTATP